MARITVLSVGSRGDVQPYVALARGLARAGYDVRLAVPERLAWLGAELSAPVVGLKEEPLRTFSRMVTRGGPRKPVASWRHARAAMFGALDEWDAAVAGSDLVVSHPQVFAAPEIARRHGAAVVFADTLPASCPTSEYPCCYLFERSLGGPVNRWSYGLIPWALTPLRAWAAGWLAAKGVGDSPSGRWDLHRRDGSPVPHLHGHSEALLPRPRDWPDAWRVTGYWRAEPPAAWTPDPRLAAFLDAGPPPIYLGFGSMVYRGDRGRLARELAEPLLERGERVLLVRGWAFDDAELRGTSDVLFFDEYEGPWHSWLFERVRAVIHHGGPGTVGAALHAGRPQLCCPFAMDQPFWARRAWRLGVAPAPLSIRRWSMPAWRQRVSRLLSDDAIQEKAIVLAGRLSAEDGVARAVEAIHDLAEGRLPGARRPG